MLIAALFWASPALTQSNPPTPYDRAIAAGYKALTLCSGIFNAGRTEAQIEALELKGIYPEYDAIVPTLAARVDSDNRIITVPFEETLPPREANWRRGFGCTVDPIGTPIVPPATDNLALGVAPPDARPWPDGDQAAPAKPASVVKKIADAAFDQATFGKGSQTTAVLVVEDGNIIDEQYRDGFGMLTSQRTWSVAKSLSGTLIGIAVREKLLDPRAPADIPEWKPNDPRRAITLGNLLRMASGLHTDTAGNRTDAIYFGGTSVTEQATAWPLEAMPGARFRYANNDILLAIRSLRAAIADDARYDDFPRVELFAKLGMTRTVAERDWDGNFILSSQVWSTARDLARFGLLYLNDGVWNGERLLPEGWVKYVTTPSGPQPEGEFGYGATFWLMSRSPGVPADTFAAFGNRGQYVVIVPSRKVVIVRRGEDPGTARFDIARFTADVLAALR